MDAHPLTLAVSETPAAIQAGHPISVALDGAALLRWIRWRLESSAGSSAGGVIDTVLRVRAGTLTADDQAVLFLSGDSGDCAGMLHECEHVDFGALYSIVCRDFAGRLDKQRLKTSIDGRRAYSDLFDPGPLLDACDGWPVGVAGAAPSGSITGQVPALIMRGWYDPLSAPVGDIATEVGIAAHTYVLEVPNQSVNSMGFTPCPRDIRDAWIDAPLEPPAHTSCLGTIPAIDLTGAPQ